jgi:RNA polymerase sigma factor (sigma-70 family)
VEQPLGMTIAWEWALRERLLAGEERALAELYDQFFPMVYGLAARVTGDRTAAEDLTQEVFVSLWERPEAFDPGRGRLRTWLAAITHHRAVDLVRRRAVRQRHATEAAPEPPAPSMEELAVAAAVAKRVRAAVDDLPDDQRTAIMLAYFEGRTYRQVAEILGIPEGTAKSRMRLALRRIACRLEAEGITADG